jgi:hypothetical protein
MASNFNNTTPAAPAGFTNIIWQTDGAGNDSAYVATSGAEVYKSLSAGLTANFNSGSPQTLFTPTVAAAYRISWTQAIVVAGSVSSTFPSLTLGWTDVGSIARTKTLVATSAVNTTAVESDGSAIIYTNNATAVTVTSASYASSAAGMTYSLAITAELL